jgi:hypothetical protein
MQFDALDAFNCPRNPETLRDGPVGAITLLDETISNRPEVPYSCRYFEIPHFSSRVPVPKMD